MATIAEGKIVKVNMGLIAYGGNHDVLETLLGSCVGVAIWDPNTQVAGLAHVVLPDSRGQKDGLGKFADTAIPAIKKQLVRQGAHPLRLQAKIAGGAMMFGQSEGQTIGDMNQEAVKEHLEEHRIKLVSEHVGGRKGLYIRFFCEAGAMDILITRQVVATI